jgi:F0F1-type ATP synthase membrane subunit b/b'
MELNPINQLNPVTIGATIVTFTATYVVMRKVFFLPLIEVMERRNAHRVEAEGRYSEAEGILSRAEEESRAILARSDEKVRELVEQTRAKAEEGHEATLAAARAMAENALERGRAAIAEEAGAERARLRADAVECVSLSCEKLFGRVDRSAVEANVDRVIAKTVR